MNQATMNQTERMHIHCFSSEGFSEVVGGWTEKLDVVAPFEKHIFTISVISSAFVSLSNVILIIGMLKVNKTLSLTNKLFIYLSVVDILSVTTSPFNFYFTQNTSIPCWLISLEIAFEIFIRAMGVMVVFLISALRLLSIWKPFYRVGTATLVKALVVFNTSLVASSTFMFFEIYNEMSVNRFGIYQIAVGLIALVTILINLACNIISKCMLESKLKQTNLHQGMDTRNQSLVSSNPATTKTSMRINPSTSRIQQTTLQIPQITSQFNQTTSPTHNKNATPKKMSTKRNAVNTLIIITCFYLALYFPFCVYLVFGGIYLVVDVNANFSTYLRLLQYGGLVNVITFANSGVNALVYVFRSKRIKTYYKLLFKPLLLYCTQRYRE